MVFFIPADANSVNVTPPQDTPMSNKKDGKYVNFGIDVEIQKPIEKLPRGKNDNKLWRIYRGGGGESGKPPPHQPQAMWYSQGNSLAYITQVDRATFERNSSLSR